MALPGRRRPLPAAGAGFLGVTPARVTHERQRIFALDTNIFIYHFEANPAYVGFTEALFDRIESGRVKAITSALTLHEVLTGARKAGDDRLFALYTLARETARDNKDLLYAYITDRSGAVLVHTFKGGMPAGLLGLPPLAPGEATRVRLLRTETGMIRHIAVPVLGGRAGTVHVGMSEDKIRATIAGYIRRIVLITSLVLVGGGLLGFGVATILGRPLTQLASAAEAVGRGDFTWRPPRWAHDEIGRLGASFAVMAERLGRMQAELRRRGEVRTRLLDQVITAQEEERRRIARELHDETGQALTSLTLGLAQIREARDLDEARARAGELRGLAGRYGVEWTRPRFYEFAAALGAVQVDRMEEIVAWKRAYAATHLDPKFPNRVRLPEGMVSGLYKYIVFEPIERSSGKVYDTPCHTIMQHSGSFPHAEWVAGHHWCVPLYYDPNGAMMT